MRSSYGGICYNGIQNMTIPEIFEYSNELSKLIERENKGNQDK